MTVIKSIPVIFHIKYNNNFPNRIEIFELPIVVMRKGFEFQIEKTEELQNFINLINEDKEIIQEVTVKCDTDTFTFKGE